MKPARWIRPTILAGGLALAGAVTAAILVFDHALHERGIDIKNAWFTGEALLVTVVALGVAGAAVLFTLPAYGEWRQALKRRPIIKITIQACMDSRLSELAMIPPDGTFKHRAIGPHPYDVFLRVGIHNEGDGPLEGGELNVMTPWGYDPVPYSPHDAVLPLHRIPGPLEDPDLRPGQTSGVALLAVAADFPPRSVRMFHLLCRSCPPGETIDLVARVTGNEVSNPLIARMKIVVEPYAAPNEP